MVESFEAPPSSRESKVARAMKTRSSGKSRGKKKGPFVFPARKAYPIGDMSHAKRALIFSTWPDNTQDAEKVRDAVFKRYPKLRDWFLDGKYAKHAESFGAENKNNLISDLKKAKKGAKSFIENTEWKNQFVPAMGVTEEEFDAGMERDIEIVDDILKRLKNQSPSQVSEYFRNLWDNATDDNTKNSCYNINEQTGLYKYKSDAESFGAETICDSCEVNKATHRYNPIGTALLCFDCLEEAEEDDGGNMILKDEESLYAESFGAETKFMKSLSQKDMDRIFRYLWDNSEMTAEYWWNNSSDSEKKKLWEMIQESNQLDAESFSAEVCPCGCAMVGCVCSPSCKGECLGAESFEADDEPYCQSCGATLEEVREGLCECPGDCQEGEHLWRIGSLYQDGNVIIGTNGVCTECGLEKRELFSDDITWTYNDAESFSAEVCPCGCAMVGCVCSPSCKGECLGAESFEAEWDFGDDRKSLRKGDEHSDFNNAWRWIFKTQRREWPKWGQKFYDKYEWTLDDPHWNPQLDAESFEAEKIEGQTQSNIYAKFFVGHVSKDELRGNGKFKTYDSALKKAKEVAKREGNSRVVSPMGAALWTSNDKGLFQVGHLTKEAKRFYNSEEEMAVGYLSAESALYEAPMGIHDEYCIRQGPFCVMDRMPGKTLCVKCDEEFGEMFPHDAEYTALGVPARRISASEIMSPSMRVLRNMFIIGGALFLFTAVSASTPKDELLPLGNVEDVKPED